MTSDFHFIGIGGAGLSAIAKVLLEKGYAVSGSDIQDTQILNSLRKAGANISIGHNPNNVRGAKLIIRSSAIPDSNVEVQGAHSAGIKVVKRLDFLPQLLVSDQQIAVAGTHGKSTTTAMIAWLLTSLGLDPSYIIGSVAKNLSENAHAGQDSLFIIEADEYDHMFLGLNPAIAVITNIEHDHPDFYPTPEDFNNAFRQFLNTFTSDGILIACTDDPGASRLSKEYSQRGGRTITYGISQPDSETDTTYHVTNLKENDCGCYRFDLYKNGSFLTPVNLNVPGTHNVLNSIAAMAVADELELSIKEASQKIEEFSGIDRRFDIVGKKNDITVIDDYAHHPTEIRATISAARTLFSGSNIWVVWQPHTYTRTNTFLKQFSKAFDDAHSLIVTDVYAARETAPKEFSIKTLINSIDHKSVRHIPDFDRIISHLLEHLHPGDILLVLSAGDANKISKQVLDGLGTDDGQ